MLKQVRVGSQINKRVVSSDLGLVVCFADEWDLFISKLYQGNINMCAKSDKLVWDFNASEGQVTATLAYLSLVLNIGFIGSDWWTKWIWRGSTPLKIKLFFCYV